MKDEQEHSSGGSVVLLQPLAFILHPCAACPCPGICTGGVLCELAPDPTRHAHIRNVSAIKQGIARPVARTQLPAERRALDPPMADSPIPTPCCGS